MLLIVKYVKKIEVPAYLGGVCAIKFNSNGDIIDYNIILKGTTANCGGGRTPWGTWICSRNIVICNHSFSY